jgi:hypothetical protein
VHTGDLGGRRRKAERLARPGDDLLSVLASGEQHGVYTREEVVANAAR